MSTQRAAKPDKHLRKATLLIVFLAVFTVLYVAQDVFIPIALAILVTFVLSPVATSLEKYLRFPRSLAAVIVVGAVCALTVTLGYVVGDQFVQFAKDLPNYKTEISKKITTLRGTGSGFFGGVAKSLGDIQEATEKSADQAKADATKASPAAATQPIGTTSANPLFVSPVNSGFSGYLGVLGQILGPLGTIGLVLVLVLFMLLERDDLRDRLIRLSSSGRYTVTTQALADATDRIGRYLRAQLIVNGTYGIAISVGLFVIGLAFGHGQTFPSFILFGVLCAVLRFIPYVGPWIAAAFPLAVSLAVFPGFGVFIATGLMFVVIELLSNNFMEPLLYGSSTGISTVALLVAAILWTFLWGPYGLLMATPITVVLVVIGRHVPSLAFLDVLLGDRPALPAGDRFYQRLIAGDDGEAGKLARDYAEEHGTIAAADDVVIPAIRMTRHDRHADDLSADEEAAIFATADKILQRSQEQIRDAANNAGDVDQVKRSTPVDLNDAATDEAERVVRQPLIVALPAHHRAEMVAISLVAGLLQPIGARLDGMACSVMPADAETHIAEQQPAAIFIAIVPPGGATQARYLCRRLRRKFKDLPIVVGYFGPVRDYDAMLIRFRAAGATYVTTSVGQTRSQLASLLKLTISPEVELVQTGKPAAEESGDRLSSVSPHESAGLCEPVKTNPGKVAT